MANLAIPGDAITIDGKSICDVDLGLPDCVSEFLMKLSPIKLGETSDVFKQSWADLSAELDGDLNALKDSFRDYKDKALDFNNFSEALNQLDTVFKCNGDEESCGSIAEAAKNIKNLLDQITLDLQVLNPSGLIKQAVAIGKKLLNETFQWPVLNFVGVECPKQELTPDTTRNDDPVPPEPPENLTASSFMRGVLLRWDPPSNTPTERILGYEIAINNAVVAAVPYFTFNYFVNPVPADSPFIYSVRTFNTDPNPLYSEYQDVINVSTDNPLDVPAPVITSAIPYYGGFYLGWEMPEILVDTTEYSDIDYTAVVIDADDYFIAVNNDFDNITAIRNDSVSVPPPYNTFYDLSGADITIGSTYRATLDDTNPLNITIGLQKTDSVSVDYYRQVPASFTFVSGVNWIVRLDVPELSPDISSIQRVDDLYRVRPTDGAYDTYSVTGYNVLDYNSFQIEAASGFAGYDVQIKLNPQIQTFSSFPGDNVEVTFDGLGAQVATLINSQQLILGVANFQVTEVPNITEIKNLTRSNIYNLNGMVSQTNQNANIGANLSDTLLCNCKVRRKVDHINPLTWTLTTLNTTFSTVSGIYNATKDAYYSLSGASFIKGSTLIKIDPTTPKNQIIGMRDDDLIRVKSDDVTQATFNLDATESNDFDWRLDIKNYELGTTGFIEELYSIQNIDRGGQTYNLTNATWTDNYIILNQSDGLNSEIGIDPRDRLKAEYKWRRFFNIVGYEIWLNESGLPLQYYNRVGLVNNNLEIGSRASIQGNTQELFKVDSTNDTFNVFCNGISETVTLEHGTDLSALDISADIIGKTNELGATVSSGYLVLTCKNLIPRNPLGSGTGLPTVSGVDPCVQAGTCLINDQLEIIDGNAVTYFGFTPDTVSTGISFENGIPLSIAILAVDNDGKRTPLTLSGPNITTLTPSAPIFNIYNTSTISYQPGFIYNSACGDPKNIVCYDSPEYAWALRFDLQSPNRELIAFDEAIKASVDDATSYEVSIPVALTDFNDILTVGRIDTITGAYSQYDLTNASISISSEGRTIIDLDENITLNQLIGMTAVSIIGVQTDDSYSYSSGAGLILRIPLPAAQPTPEISISAGSELITSSESQSFYGTDPYVKLADITAEVQNFDSSEIIGNTELKTFTLRASFQATSEEGVSSISLLPRAVRNTYFFPVTQSFTLLRGDTGPNQLGVYEAIQTVSFRPRDVYLYSTIIAVNPLGSVPVPGYFGNRDLLEITLDSGTILRDGQFDPTNPLDYKDSWTYTLSRVPSVLEFEIYETHLATNIVVVDITNAGGLGISPGDTIRIKASADNFDLPITDLFNPSRGYVVTTSTNTAPSSVISYSLNDNLIPVYLTSEALRINPTYPTRPQDTFNIPGINAFDYNQLYASSDMNIGYIDDQNWIVTAQIRNQLLNPLLQIFVEGRNSIGEEILGEENYQIT